MMPAAYSKGMKKLLIALLALALTACTMTQSEQQSAGTCLETGFDLQCTP